MTEESDHLDLAIMKLITADEGIARGDPESVAMAMNALAGNLAGVLVGVMLAVGEHEAREVAKTFSKRVNADISSILGKTVELIDEHIKPATKH